MRFRFQNKKKNRHPVTGVRTKFAWIPVRLTNKTWIWLEKYRVGPPRRPGRSLNNVVLGVFDADQDSPTAQTSAELFEIRRSA